MKTNGDMLAGIRANPPLIHNITNFVAMNSMANILLATGASPAMVHSHEEVEEFTALASALTLNIGTLEPEWVASMILAAKAANSNGIPWVFDPVGVGATQYRQQSSQLLLELKPSVIRGNASEILALAGMTSRAQGVDSGDSVYDAEQAAVVLARQTSGVVVVTGAIDFVTDAVRTARIGFGSPMMSKVTTMGCSLNGVIAAFCVGNNHFDACVAALTYYAKAGEIAASKANGPGSFAVQFIDSLYNLSPVQLDQLSVQSE